jgi:hypothetical protein
VSRARTWAVVAAGLALGVALRLYVATAAEGKSFSDNAVVALMAMHALRGKFYAFYWGQSYMGSLEPLVVAPFFALFGVGDLALSAGLLPWYALYAIALYAIARRIGGELAGALALVFAALAPSDVQFLEVTARGGYPATIAFGTVLLWLSLRFARDPLSPRSRSLHVTAIGFVAGLAFWTNWLVLPYFVVCAALLLGSDPRLPFRAVALLALGAFLVASAPLWIYNVRHGFPSFALVAVADAPGAGESIRWALSPGIPNMLGIRDLHGVWALGTVGRVLAIATVAATIVATFRLRGSFLAIVRGRPTEADPSAFLWLLAMATVVVYVATLPSRFQIGRYLLPLTTAATALLALGIASLYERRRALGVAALAALVAFYGRETVKLARDLRSMPGRYTAGPVDRLVAELDAAGIRFGYASYADAAVATYISAERLVIADYEERYYPMEEVDFRDPALVVANDSPPARGSLEAVNARFAERVIPGYRIYWPARYDGVTRGPLDRSGWQVTTFPASADAELLTDGDPWSVWSADAAAGPAIVTVDLGREQRVAGVYLQLGELKKDGFRRVRVETFTERAGWHVTKEASWDFPIHFRADGRLTILPDDVQLVLFPPESASRVRLTLLEGNPGRRWTIGELVLLGSSDDGVAFRKPVFTDPSTPALVERRLRRAADRDPSTNRPLVELAALYEKTGDADRRREVDAFSHDRFTPRTLLGWRFGRAIRLVGYDCSIVGPRELEITYYWRAERRMRTAYAMSGHFEGPGFRFQDDYVMGAPVNPTGGWIPGEVVKEKRRIVIPREAPAGRYTLEIGVWAPATGERLATRSSWRSSKSPTLFALEIDRDRLVIADR